MEGAYLEAVDKCNDTKDPTTAKQVEDGESQVVLWFHIIMHHGGGSSRLGTDHLKGMQNSIPHVKLGAGHSWQPYKPGWPHPRIARLVAQSPYIYSQ